MKADWKKLFRDSAVQVFQDQLRVELTPHGAKTGLEGTSTRILLVIVGLTGACRGQIVFAMGQAFADLVAGELRQPVNLAVGQLAEAIVGRVVGQRKPEDGTLDLTPPVVLTSSGPVLDFLAVPAVGLTLGSPMGLLEIEIALTGSGEPYRGDLRT